MNKEIWKDIPNYEGLYQVSNLGRVKSLDRMVKHSNCRTLYLRKGVVIKPSKGSHGYLCVSVRLNNKRKTRTIHSLVAESFLNHKPCGHKLVVNHIDFNKHNNNVSNLEIITQRENTNKKHCKSYSKYVGVYWSKIRKLWVSQILIKGEIIYLGGFKCELGAAKAYNDKLKEIIVNY